jgi:hypothetical protein
VFSASNYCGEVGNKGPFTRQICTLSFGAAWSFAHTIAKLNALSLKRRELISHNATGAVAMFESGLELIPEFIEYSTITDDDVKVSYLILRVHKKEALSHRHNSLVAPSYQLTINTYVTLL